MSSPVFCDNCRRLYPAEGLDHFALLGYEPTFAIDPAELRWRYLQTSRGIHPDRHGATVDQEMSVRLSAQLNEAYRVLGDPVLRAEYLLEVLGGAAASDDRRVLDGVLAQAMLLREEAAEARAADDAPALAACGRAARTRHDELLARIVTLAQGLSGDPAVRGELRATLNSIKYFQKLVAELQ